MKKKLKVGIIGNGFVGEAISFAFSSVSELFIFDINPLKSFSNLKQIHNCDFVFVCVPTPMFKDGSQDLSYVEEVFQMDLENQFILLNLQYYLEQQKN